MAGCRKDRFRNHTIVPAEKLDTAVISKYFECATPVGPTSNPETAYEIRSKPQSVTMNNPVVISAEVLQRAKLC